MKLLSIEPTPSPNTMKLNVDVRLDPGVRLNYGKNVANATAIPPLVARLLDVPGIKGVFHTSDFLAIDRKGNADWAAILDGVREAFGLAGDGAASAAGPETEGFGEAHVRVQMFRGIPMQIRVRSGGQEFRAAMPERFSQAVSEAAGSTMIRERKLEELGVRYGEPQEVLDEVQRELEAAYSEARLQDLIAQAKAAGPEAAPPAPPAPLTGGEVLHALESQDWRERYAALERLKPKPEDLEVIAAALRDSQVSVRRLAVVYLGDLRTPETMSHLFTALKDSSGSVRRTAGDTLSDLGDTAAIGPMIEALEDSNKLVRWRAARFLYEAGDESALEALRRIAGSEPEFEVRLQAEMAVARIERGEEAAGSVWQQMTRMREQDKE
ncbi:conserved virulence factor C family protein [Cohnella silvisoli]|uniref:Conserved virulence factor C family protein n=1 Tax=Cohnella silvisoli TaxID=2873699 RepID=A0ABV1KXJ1_9BACL|nr:conserved virulence factor C family protein [Cohnella silvisoli]MCD9023704.1 conserved virulence factor C family protein [Cohnella silvisoli]